MDQYLVYDIGGTHIKSALLDGEGKVLKRFDLFAAPKGEGKTINDLVDLLEEKINRHQKKIEGIAISMPGILDCVSGTSLTFGAIDYPTPFNLVEIIKERYGIYATIHNDGKAAALAELWKGKLKDVDNGAVILLGTGVGGGIIIDGKLYTGKHFYAGEFSYLCVNDERAQDEDMSGFWGKIGGIQQLIYYVAEKTGKAEEKLNGVKIFELMNAGNKKAIAALEQYVYSLVIQIYNLQMILDLDVIAIGGGISRQPILMEYIQKHIDAYYNMGPQGLVKGIEIKPNVTCCKFFNDSNMVGALYHHLMQK